MTPAGAITETTLLAATDAGMHALWNPQIPALTSRERQYLLVSSQPYRYLSDGTVHLTGMGDFLPCGDVLPSRCRH